MAYRHPDRINKERIEHLLKVTPPRVGVDKSEWKQQVEFVLEELRKADEIDLSLKEIIDRMRATRFDIRSFCNVIREEMCPTPDMRELWGKIEVVRRRVGELLSIEVRLTVNDDFKDEDVRLLLNNSGDGVRVADARSVNEDLYRFFNSEIYNVRSGEYVRAGVSHRAIVEDNKRLLELAILNLYDHEVRMKTDRRAPSSSRGRKN